MNRTLRVLNIEADVIMPEMGGRDVVDRLAHLRPEMKALYMSGYTDNAIVHQGVLNEGANFIQKPFSPGTLGQKVRQVFGREHFCVALAPLIASDSRPFTAGFLIDSLSFSADRAEVNIKLEWTYPKLLAIKR